MINMALRLGGFRYSISSLVVSLPKRRSLQTLCCRRFWSYNDRKCGSYWRIRERLIFVRPLIVTSFTIPFFNQSKKPSSVGFPSSPALPSSVPIEMSRVMLPDDTNVMGNVHGGTILKLIEQAGHIVSSRHCNKGATEAGRVPLTTVLVRVERMDFHQPMYVGEVAQLQAAVTYTSPHSVEVTVDVWGESVISGERRHTNTATLWYIAVPANLKKEERRKVDTKDSRHLRQLLSPVPQLEGLSEKEQAEGKKRYERQKEARDLKNGSESEGPCHVHYSTGEAEEHSVLASQTTLANIVLPSDCTVTGHLMGGSLMKTMDNAAGICAARHCRQRVVTACIDEIDFHKPIMNGEMIFVTARIVYTSAKSMEIEVTTEAEGLLEGRHITNTAYFTFVSLGEDCRARPIPQLKLGSKEDEARYEEGRKRYEARKKARIAKMEELRKQM